MFGLKRKTRKTQKSITSVLAQAMRKLSIQLENGHSTVPVAVAVVHDVLLSSNKIVFSTDVVGYEDYIIKKTFVNSFCKKLLRLHKEREEKSTGCTKGMRQSEAYRHLLG